MRIKCINIHVVTETLRFSDAVCLRFFYETERLHRSKDVLQEINKIMWCHNLPINVLVTNVGTQHNHPLRVLRQNYTHTLHEHLPCPLVKLSRANANTTGSVGDQRQVLNTLREESSLTSIPPLYPVRLE